MDTKKIVFPEVHIDVWPNNVVLTDIENAVETAVYSLGVKHGFAAALTALRFGDFDEAILELGRKHGFYESAMGTVPHTVWYHLEPRLFRNGTALYLRNNYEPYRTQWDRTRAIEDAVRLAFRDCRKHDCVNECELVYFGSIAPGGTPDAVRARLAHRLISSQVVIGEHNGFRIVCDEIPAETLQEAAADGVIASLGLDTPRGVVEAILRRTPWIAALDKGNGHEYP